MVTTLSIVTTGLASAWRMIRTDMQLSSPSDDSTASEPITGQQQLIDCRARQTAEDRASALGRLRLTPTACCWPLRMRGNKRCDVNWDEGWEARVRNRG